MIIGRVNNHLSKMKNRKNIINLVIILLLVFSISLQLGIWNSKETFSQRNGHMRETENGNFWKIEYTILFTYEDEANEHFNKGVCFEGNSS